MRIFSFTIFLLLVFSCSKNEENTETVLEKNESKTPYDTVAIDSFSAGATSIDVVRKIQISTQEFQDSLKQVKLRVEAEQTLKKSKEEKLKAEEKILRENKKTVEVEKEDKTTQRTD